TAGWRRFWHYQAARCVPRRGRRWRPRRALWPTSWPSCPVRRRCSRKGYRSRERWVTAGWRPARWTASLAWRGRTATPRQHEGCTRRVWPSAVPPGTGSWRRSACTTSPGSPTHKPTTPRHAHQVRPRALGRALGDEWLMELALLDLGVVAHGRGEHALA